jgi:hypothetical protein
MIDLVLFENDPEGASINLAAGISSFLIDTETLGKDLRQLGFDTEIRLGTLADLQSISAMPKATCWCRINRYGDHTRAEVQAAIRAGADVVLLPMVKTLVEIAGFLEIIDQQCQAAIMLETIEGAAIAQDIRSLPVDHVFFGLNDFAISRGGGSIFKALVDGSVESVRQALPEVSFGVGGLTDINRGFPIPSARILEELERLHCDFTLLRRSFRRDAKSAGAKPIVEGLRDYWDRCSRRTDLQRSEDHEKLRAIIDNLEP